MNTAGKVFAVLNVLLVFAFLLCTAPVVKYRIDMRRQIDEEAAKVPGLRTQIKELRKTGVELGNAILLEKANVTSVRTAGLNEKSLLEARIAVREDEVNNEKSKRQTLAGSLRDVRSEIDARIAQAEELTRKLTTTKAENDDLSQQVSDLRSKLAVAEEAVAKTRASIKESYGKILALESKIFPSLTARKVASKP